jgi:hypothetical protein
MHSGGSGFLRGGPGGASSQGGSVGLEVVIFDRVKDFDIDAGNDACNGFLG